LCTHIVSCTRTFTLLLVYFLLRVMRRFLMLKCPPQKVVAVHPLHHPLLVDVDDIDDY
jgi:hypothetical protein